jgi:hypothetical protein
MAATIRAVTALLLVGGLAACGDDDGDSDGGGEAVDAPDTITVTSPAFADGEEVPVEFTCDGEDVSPALAWSGVPEDALELAVIMEDPDASGGTFVHWVLWGLDAGSPGLTEDGAPDSAPHGSNGAGDTAWAGPCPPEGSGTHHYEFTVLALSGPLDVEPGASADEVRQAAEDVVLAQGQLTGIYER